MQSAIIFVLKTQESSGVNASATYLLASFYTEPKMALNVPCSNWTWFDNIILRREDNIVLKQVWFTKSSSADASLILFFLQLINILQDGVNRYHTHILWWFCPAGELSRSSLSFGSNLDAYFILVSMKHLLRAMIIKNLIGLEQLWRVMTTWNVNKFRYMCFALSP